MTLISHEVRRANVAEADALARLWYDAWHDAHAAIVPADLVSARTLESFRRRMMSMLPRMRVVGFVGEPTGFHFIERDELEHLFVAAEFRGCGVAKKLLDDAERALRESGVTTAWLACAIGNRRAANFYEKCGWQYDGPMINRLDVEGREYSLEVWRYEKTL